MFHDVDFPRHFGDLRRLDHQRQHRAGVLLVAAIVGVLLMAVAMASYTGCHRAPAFCGGLIK